VPTFLFYWSYKLFPKFKLINASLILIAITAIASISFSEKRGNFVHLLTRKQYDFNNVALGGIHAHLDSTFYFFSTDKLAAIQIESDSIKIIRPVTAVAYKHGDISHPREVDFLPNEQKLFIYFQNSKCKGYLETTPINNSSLQLLLNSPEALINALFRPIIGDVGGKLKYFATIEILLVYSLLIFAIFRRRKLNDEQKNRVFSALIFIISLSLLIGWVTPVIGAIARYRLPVLVGLTFIALVLINPSKKYRRHE
jgi:hypothetical protein